MLALHVPPSCSPHLPWVISRFPRSVGIYRPITTKCTCSAQPASRKVFNCLVDCILGNSNQMSKPL
jgi:hypothetical protein